MKNKHHVNQAEDCNLWETNSARRSKIKLWSSPSSLRFKTEMVNTFHFTSATNHSTTSHSPKDSVRWTKGGGLGISGLKGEASGEFPGAFLSPVCPTWGYLWSYTHQPYEKPRARKGWEDMTDTSPLCLALREAALLCPPLKKLRWWEAVCQALSPR